MNTQIMFTNCIYNAVILEFFTKLCVRFCKIGFPEIERYILNDKADFDIYKF